eukprot:3064484-Rhodomonas_salina.2
MQVCFGSPCACCITLSVDLQNPSDLTCQDATPPGSCAQTLTVRVIRAAARPLHAAVSRHPASAVRERPQSAVQHELHPARRSAAR